MGSRLLRSRLFPLGCHLLALRRRLSLPRFRAGRLLALRLELLGLRLDALRCGLLALGLKLLGLRLNALGCRLLALWLKLLWFGLDALGC